VDVWPNVSISNAKLWQTFSMSWVFHVLSIQEVLFNMPTSPCPGPSIHNPSQQHWIKWI